MRLENRRRDGSYRLAIRRILLVLALCASTLASPQKVGSLLGGLLGEKGQDVEPDSGDFNCQSPHNPVLVVHGLLSPTSPTDLLVLELFLKSQGYCTFRPTYGAYDAIPDIGGLRPMADSMNELADMVVKINAAYDGRKVDIVGHSEGALMVLYLAKFGGVQCMIEHVVSIAPPTHGVPLYGVGRMVPRSLFKSVLFPIIKAVGCPACNDMLINGDAVRRLNDGTPIAQPGHKVTIITSRLDQGVFPGPKISFVHEPGVNNIALQDYCPFDISGHFSEPLDRNVWQLVIQAFNDQIGQPIDCKLTTPLR